MTSGRLELFQGAVVLDQPWRPEQLELFQGAVVLDQPWRPGRLELFQGAVVLDQPWRGSAAGSHWLVRHAMKLREIRRSVRGEGFGRTDHCSQPR
jgi:hypothetical protein